MHPIRESGLVEWVPLFDMSKPPPSQPAEFWQEDGAPPIQGLQVSDLPDSPAQLRKLFVGGLSHSTTHHQLAIYFSQWGPVVEVLIVTHATTKLSRGFGFVTFASLSDTEAAFSHKPHIIGMKMVELKRAIPRDQLTSIKPSFMNTIPPPPECKLLLSGVVPESHSIDALRLYFDTFGTLDHVEISGQKSPGLGFITYEDQMSADQCLSVGHHIINGIMIQVEALAENGSSATWKCQNSTTPTSFSRDLYERLD